MAVIVFLSQSWICLCAHHISKLPTQLLKILLLPPFPRKLFILWSSLKVTNLLTRQSIQVPNSVSLSFRQRIHLSNILRQPFNAYMYVTHQGFANMLNPPEDVSFPVEQTPSINSHSLYPNLVPNFTNESSCWLYFFIHYIF